MKIHFIIIFWIINVICLLAQTKPASSASRGASPISVISGQSSVVKNTFAVVVGISDYQDKDIPDLGIKMWRHLRISCGHLQGVL